MNTVISLAHTLMYFQLNLKTYHWNTRSYARHLASSELVDEIEKFTDAYIENMQEILRDKTPFQGHKIDLIDTSTEEDGEVLVRDLLDFILAELMPALENQASSGIMNRAQELEEHVIRTLYKFRLV